jgi:hypothetical protein
MKRHYATSTRRLCYNIADLVFSITSPDPNLKLKLDEPAARFSCRSSVPHVRLETRWSDLSNGAITGNKLFDPGVSWQLYDSNGDYLFVFYSPSSGNAPYKAARMKPDLMRGEVLLDPRFFNVNEPQFPLDYPLDEVLLVSLLSRGRGAQLHACGLVDALGNGHLFAGHSGAGKSTIAAILKHVPGVTILSDDRIAVRMKNGQPWIYGTPWHGDAGLASSASAPLQTIFFLSKDTTNRLLPLPETLVVGRLFACSFPPFFDPGGIEFALSFFDDLRRAVPSYELRFRADEEIAYFFENVIVSAPHLRLTAHA